MKLCGILTVNLYNRVVCKKDKSVVYIAKERIVMSLLNCILQSLHGTHIRIIYVSNRIRRTRRIRSSFTLLDSSSTYETASPKQTRYERRCGRSFTSKTTKIQYNNKN